MRIISLKLVGILVVGLFSQIAVHAQDAQQFNDEIRMLQEYAQQQTGQQPQQYETVQSNSQNVSYNQPYQEPPTPAVAAPEREDLFNAANGGNVQQINKLISQGLDVNVTNGERETALHMASARGHYQAVIALVRSGSYVNARTVKNWIPLHHAVRFRHPNIANYLINKGSSAGARTSDGLSAIDMAKNNQDYRLLSIMGAR